MKTIHDVIRHCTTEKQLAQVFGNLCWNVNCGRRGTLEGYSGFICLNDFVKIFQRVFQKNPHPVEALNLIRAIRFVDSWTYDFPPVWTLAFAIQCCITRLARFLGNAFYDRNQVLDSMENRAKAKIKGQKILDSRRPAPIPLSSRPPLKHPAGCYLRHPISTFKSGALILNGPRYEEPILCPNTPPPKPKPKQPELWVLD